MMYNATREIERVFEENGIKCRTVETDHTSAVEAGFSGKNAPSVTIHFISTDNDNDVAVRILSFVKSPDAKRGAVLEAINALQQRFRYVNFTIDDDNDVHVAYDIPVRVENVGEIAVEMFIRMMQISDDAYPVLMRAIWGA